MYKISSELLIKVTKAIDSVQKQALKCDENCSDKVVDLLAKKINSLIKVNREIKEKYDLKGYKR